MIDLQAVKEDLVGMCNKPNIRHINMPNTKFIRRNDHEGRNVTFLSAMVFNAFDVFVSAPWTLPRPVNTSLSRVGFPC